MHIALFTVTVDIFHAFLLLYLEKKHPLHFHYRLQISGRHNIEFKSSQLPTTPFLCTPAESSKSHNENPTTLTSFMLENKLKKMNPCFPCRCVASLRLQKGVGGIISRIRLPWPTSHTSRMLTPLAGKQVICKHSIHIHTTGYSIESHFSNH